VTRIFTRLAAIATVGAAIAFSPAANAQGEKPAQPRAQRIVIVNIAKVLKDYNKANFRGAEITTKRETYVKQVQAYKDQISAVNADFVKTQDPVAKKALQEKALAIQRQIEDVDRDAQRILTQLSNDTIVQVYQEIKGVIFDIAKTNNLDMVMCYPAASNEKDENSPQVAQLMLQTPALIPFYHSQMDITHVVVETLNKRYASPPAPTRTVGATEPGGRTPSTTPMPPMPGGGN
jgi:Skp family chaperone for outer membrane proteins